MSLQVWLPLTKDLSNQGLSDLSFTSSGIASATDGKLGGCYNNTSNTTGYLLSNTTISLGSNQSMFCWVKFTSLESSYSLGGGLVSQHRYSSNTGMGLTIKYVSSTTGYLSVNTGNGSSRTYNSYCATTLMSAGTWYHVGYTYDGTYIKLYVNGTLEKTQAYSGMSVPADYLTVYCWSMSGTSGNSIYEDYHLNGKINDVRVYDHCLSQAEVREIAQGLVLHYSLRDSAIENTTNCVTYPIVTSTSYSPGWDTTKHTNAITVKGWSSGYNSGVSNPSTGYHACWKLIDDIPTIVFQDKNSEISQTHRWLGISGGGLTTSQIYAGITYTISFDAKADVEGKQVSTGLYYKQTSSGSNNFYDGCSAKTITTSWARYSWTYTCSQMYSISSMYIYGHYGTEGISYVRNIQVEIKDHSTLYTPSNRTTTIINDSSGFGNNGTISGTLTATADSPRGDYSISIPSGAYIGIVDKSTNTMKFGDAITISCWFYPIATDSTERYIIDCYESGGCGFCWQNQKIKWQIYANSTYTSCWSASTLTLNTWYHVTGTYDGRYIKLYINGALSNTVDMGGTYAITYNATTPWEIGGNPSAGAYASGNLTGNLSDVRIYATALLAADIANLYSNLITVDENEQVHAYEFKEV